MEYISYYEGYLDGIYKRYKIDKFCREHSITGYTINDDFTVDVSSDVDLGGTSHPMSDLVKFPFSFRNVGGYFNCSNLGLVSLKGCPVSVGGSFICSDNKLTSLEFCPGKVGGNFNCTNNSLVSLEGCPRVIGGDFYCNGNNLVNLKGCPINDIDGGFISNFNCTNNKLVSLEGCPDLINFDCSRNKLSSFKHHPHVLGSANYSNNELYDFDVEDHFFDTAIITLNGNPVCHLFNLFANHNNLRIDLMRDKMDLFRDYDMVRDDSIILDRLNSFLLDIGRSEVDGEVLSKVGYRVLHTHIRW